MNTDKLRIVYMGTPDFAVLPLRRLVESGCNVVGVVTMPDKPVGRHQNVLQASPVKQYAQQQGLPVLQPEKLKDDAFLEQLRALRADLQIVVAFRMLPQAVWQMPPLGTFNLHASLLPQYRGAAPINWAIINGERVTGNTTFFLQHQIDTGNIIEQRTLPIDEADNAGTLHDKLMELGADMVLSTLRAIEQGSVQPRPQQAGEGEILHPAPKIFKETCEIDWHRPLDELHNFVRGLSPYPAAVARIRSAKGESTLKIYETAKEPALHSLPAGSLLSDGKRTLKVAVDGGYLHLLSVQMQGKKRMPVGDFLCGLRDAAIEILL